MRDRDAVRGLQPRHLGEEQRRHIGKQAERQPFQNFAIAFVVEKYLRDHRRDAEHHHVHNAGAANQEFECVTHRSEIGGDVDRVGDEQEHDDKVQNGRRVMAADISSDAPARNPSYPAGDFLNRHHQRKGEQHGPADAVAELCAGLAISADAGWIVVGRASDKSRAECFQKAARAERIVMLMIGGRQCLLRLLAVVRLFMMHDSFSAADWQQSGPGWVPRQKANNTAPMKSRELGDRRAHGR